MAQPYNRVLGDALVPVLREVGTRTTEGKRPSAGQMAAMIVTAWQDAGYVVAPRVKAATDGR